MRSLGSYRPARTVSAQPRSHRSSFRAAHTLIEILLALGLSLVILTAVYAALDQHWRYAAAGQQQTERMQVARALFERLSLDVRSAVFRPAVDAGRSIGIKGDADTLTVQVQTTGAQRGRGSRTVCWQMRAVEAGDRDGTRIDPSRAATGAATGPVTEHAALGLVRVARDDSSPASLADLKTPAANDLVAAEVATIRFRYFAGGRWFERWDSVGQQELPRAVEITIGFRGAGVAEQPAGGRAVAGEYRVVVPVPAAEA